MYYDNDKKRQVISKTESYQEEKLIKFIETLPANVNYDRDNSKQYMAEHDPSLVFTIDTFNFINLKLQGEYKDFYELKIQPYGTNYIISANEEKLRGFCGWINRLTT